MLINFNHSYQISWPLDISRWNYGWKIIFLAKDQWPLTLQFDLWPILFTKNVCLSISILPTKFHDHWTFQAEVMAQRSYFWPKFNDLWPLTLGKFYQKLISASTCHVISLGQVWLKSVKGFSWNRVNELKYHIFGQRSMTFDLWPWANSTKN